MHIKETLCNNEHNASKFSSLYDGKNNNTIHYSNIQFQEENPISNKEQRKKEIKKKQLRVKCFKMLLLEDMLSEIHVSYK